MNVDHTLRKAARLARAGQTSDAERLYSDVLRLFPANRRALDGLAAVKPAPPTDLTELIALYNQGRLAEVVAKAGAGHSADHRLANILGVAHAGLDDNEAAIAAYKTALRLKPDFADAHNNLGIVLKRMDRMEEALASFDTALRHAPNLANAHNNRGNTLQALGRLDAAIAAFDQAIAFDPAAASALNGRGNALWQSGHPEAALANFERAVQIKPDFAEAHHNCADVLRQLGRIAASLPYCEAALHLQPDSADLHDKYGFGLQTIGRAEDAIASYGHAIAIAPDRAASYLNRANAFASLDRFTEASADYASALALRPDYTAARAYLLHLRAKAGDWTDRPDEAELTTLGIVGQAVPPFTILSLDGDPQRQLARARTAIREHVSVAVPIPPPPAKRPARLRIGYFSGEFHLHALMYLTARVFELRDPTRFEIHAFSYGPDRRDAMRQRIVTAFDAFHDVRMLSDVAIVERARELGIDIAVDLSGFTRHDRVGIFAHRPAPLQINFLGYPGTMGADFYDYIVADSIVAPPASYPDFAEKVIALPHSYLPFDDSQPAGSELLGRADYGLPSEGMVFCCFNQIYKISPLEFDVWMRLLGAIEGSVLWLIESGAEVTTNLRREAHARGINPARLIFAERELPARYIARFRLADLFLDTFNYNAHTTAADSLWGGLPVVTLAGRSFAARVAASLLNAVGMPELVTDSVQAYEALALALATDPARVTALKDRLDVARTSAPSFDSAIFARDLERAYDAAHSRYLAGLAPDHVTLAAEPSAH